MIIRVQASQSGTGTNSKMPYGQCYRNAKKECNPSISLVVLPCISWCFLVHFALFSTEKIGQKIVNLRSQRDEQASQSGWVRNILRPDNDRYLVTLKKLFGSGI